MSDPTPNGPRRPPRRPGPAADPSHAVPELDLDPDIWSDASAGSPPPRRGPRRPPGEGARADGVPVARPIAALARPARPSRARDHDDDYVDLPPEGRVPRWVVALGLVVLVAVAVVGGARWWYGNQVDPPGDPGEVVSVVVPEGASVSRVADLLAAEGIITNATIFRFWVGGKDLDTVQAGTYELRRNSSFAEAVEGLNAGPAMPVGVATTRVSIPEGLTVRETVDRIAEQVPAFTVEELQAVLDEGLVPTSLRPPGVASYEGLLFPATYEITDEATPLSLLTMMAAEMERRTQALGLDAAVGRAEASTGLDLEPYDLLIIASLVQEEAGNPDEAPQIATVIENRLRDGWALGIDATSKYLAELEGQPIDFSSTSPFNTRTQRGLPPTPIASPGEEALEAAISPADGPWMYYVLTEPGVHTFAVTNEEFLAAKRICVERDLGCG